MRNNLSHCYVIKNGKKQGSPVMGFICFRNITEESELLNIGVRPDVQRTGIGKVLMQFYIDFSSQAGVKSFYLEVNSTNQPALRLYRMFSYRSTGVRERFYQGKYDALLMERTI
jgi:ribosomal protein S18 acetylase RimI-like enzyme